MTGNGNIDECFGSSMKTGADNHGRLKMELQGQF